MSIQIEYSLLGRRRPAETVGRVWVATFFRSQAGDVQRGGVLLGGGLANDELTPIDKSVAIIPRAPLTSGLLTGKITPSYLSSLANSNHRMINTTGQLFDAGQTSSGLGHFFLEDKALLAVGRSEEVAEAVSIDKAI
ncbi:hypothetical protein M427DRAFT_37787 [Gonapodya prolifera JEL478]|uniref:Uncharacterized protein n=1 Tax=Gonapodya prolifera (strain JEL478) TaxID=1344416 RepID=A0A139A0I8_GONPJ|nr:hypothetical protein M427DRAFT_37787 [Gonapodya prolifera JEL478]|eukprot:KXS10138.1 hypothetical protein M427DRAFT_37787 [Gonapodya prolifera JEL478]